MSNLEILSLILATWGAVLSTILGFVELKKGRRRLRIILDFILDYEIHQIIIVNNGFRPVTISHVEINVIHTFPSEEQKEITENILSHESPLTEKSMEKLPCVLNEGELLSLEVSPMYHNFSTHGKGDLDIIVYDTEGKTYKINKRRYFHPETHRYTE